MDDTNLHSSSESVEPTGSSFLGINKEELYKMGRKVRSTKRSAMRKQLRNFS